jgi:hypothetical protein
MWGGATLLALLAAFGLPTPWLIVVAFFLLAWLAASYLGTQTTIAVWALREQQKTARDAAGEHRRLARAVATERGPRRTGIVCASRRHRRLFPIDEQRAMIIRSSCIRCQREGPDHAAIRSIC